MDWLLDLILRLYAMLALVPFLIYPLVGLFLYLAGQDKKTAARRAADITMVFLIGSVAATWDLVFATEMKGIWIVLLLLLLLTGLIGGMQNRMRGRLDPEKLVRAVWRLGFILLVPAYIVLSLAGMIKSLTQM